MENPIKMDDLGVPPFKETPIYFRGLLDIFFREAIVAIYPKCSPFMEYLPTFGLDLWDKCG